MAKAIINTLGPYYEVENSFSISFEKLGGSYEDDYILPEKYEHGISYAYSGEDPYEIDSIEGVGVLDVFHYDKLKPVIDEPDALPNWRFDVVDYKGNIFDENISLRDFIKKYIYEDSMVDDMYAAALKKVLEEIALEEQQKAGENLKNHQ